MRKMHQNLRVALNNALAAIIALLGVTSCRTQAKVSNGATGEAVKEPEPFERPAIMVKYGVPPSARPLYIVNDEKVEDISTISPDDIESVNVLKDSVATDKYGPSADNGVIEITLK